MFSFNRVTRGNYNPPASSVTTSNTQRAQSLRAAIKISLKSITNSNADGIVNAANCRLSSGSGVCGAIFNAAGKEKLEKACKKLGGCPPGRAVETSAFDLGSGRWIIHAVGPDCNLPDQNANRKILLESAYREAIQVADRLGLKTLAMPSLSTGVYGYDRREAAAIAIATVENELSKCSSLTSVEFCCYGDDADEVQSALNEALENLIKASSAPARAGPNAVSEPESLVPITSSESRLQSTGPSIQISDDSITSFTNADAWVNPTNSALECGGQVSRNIIEALQIDQVTVMSGLRWCEVGEAVTNNSELGESRVKVIHVVCPTYSKSTEDRDKKMLESCYTSAIKLADKNGCTSIVIPAIGTGGQGWPPSIATPVAFSAIEKALKSCKNLREVTLCYRKDAEAAYVREYNEYLDRKPAAKQGKPPSRSRRFQNITDVLTGKARGHNISSRTDAKKIPVNSARPKPAEVAPIPSESINRVNELSEMLVNGENGLRPSAVVLRRNAGQWSLMVSRLRGKSDAWQRNAVQSTNKEKQIVFFDDKSIQPGLVPLSQGIDTPFTKRGYQHFIQKSVPVGETLRLAISERGAALLVIPNLETGSVLARAGVTAEDMKNLTTASAAVKLDERKKAAMSLYWEEIASVADNSEVLNSVVELSPGWDPHFNVGLQTHYPQHLRLTFKSNEIFSEGDRYFNMESGQQTELLGTLAGLLHGVCSPSLQSKASLNPEPASLQSQSALPAERMQRFTTAPAEGASQSIRSTAPTILISNESITSFTDADAWINPTDSWLTCGGKVSEAIIGAFGFKGREELTAGLDSCPPGQAVTNGEKFGETRISVIHVNSPTYHPETHSRDKKKLALCYESAIRRADECGFSSVVIPAISTGGGGFPHGTAARVAISAVENALKTCKNLEKVTLCYQGEDAKAAYTKEYDKYSSKKSVAVSPARMAKRLEPGVTSTSGAEGLDHFREKLTPEHTEEIAYELLTKKRKHFFWYAFPIVAGLSGSKMSKTYAISGIDHAVNFLDDPELSGKLVGFTDAVLNRDDMRRAPEGQRIKLLQDRLSEVDEWKFHASMSLFAIAEQRRGNQDNIFVQALNHIYRGKLEPYTESFLNFSEKQRI